MKKFNQGKQLVEAAGCGRESEVDELLAAGVELNIKNGGETALMAAAGQNYKNIVRKLLKGGARADIIGAKGMSALSHAATRGSLDSEMIALLVDAGSPIDGRDLHVAIALRELEITRLLLSKKPDVNKRFDWPSYPAAPIQKGDTPLLVAVDDTMSERFAKTGTGFGKLRSAERMTIIELLLAAGADVNVPRLKIGAPPLILAAAHDEAGIVGLLIRAGADPNAEFDCKMAPSPISKPRTFQDIKLSAVKMARIKPQNVKVRQLLLGEIQTLDT